MNNTEFKTTGFISGYDSNGYIYIEDTNKRPVLLESNRIMMKYIDKISSSDKEEKYMTKDFIYSSHCYLEAIVIPSTDDRFPAKLIFCDWQNQQLKIFGEQEIIDTEKPEPMTREEWYAAFDWMMEKYNVNYNRIK